MPPVFALGSATIMRAGKARSGLRLVRCSNRTLVNSAESWVWCRISADVVRPVTTGHPQFDVKMASPRGPESMPLGKETFDSHGQRAPQVAANHVVLSGGLENGADRRWCQRPRVNMFPKSAHFRISRPQVDR